MCGIIGVASSKPSVDKLLIGLLRQEYRGYDSAGLAIFDETEQIQVLLTPDGQLMACRRRQMLTHTIQIIIFLSFITVLLRIIKKLEQHLKP